MTVSLRHLQPCRRCRTMRTCRLLQDEMQHAVKHIEDLAEFLTERTPDCEIVLDCKSFSPVRERKRG